MSSFLCDRRSGTSIFDHFTSQHFLSLFSFFFLLAPGLCSVSDGDNITYAACLLCTVSFLKTWWRLRSHATSKLGNARFRLCARSSTIDGLIFPLVVQILSSLDPFFRPEGYSPFNLVDQLADQPHHSLGPRRSRHN